MNQSQATSQEENKDIDYYFLNELPLDLVEVKNVRPVREVSNGIYSGDRIDNKINDFDFN